MPAPFDPAKVQITHNRRSVTQGTTRVAYDGHEIGAYCSGIALQADGSYQGKPDGYWRHHARLQAIARGWAAQPDPAPGYGWEAATARLTEPYSAPVPSQFMHMPRASQRHGREFSTLGYTRALADDCLAMAGCLDAGRCRTL